VRCGLWLEGQIAGLSEEILFVQWENLSKMGDRR